MGYPDTLAAVDQLLNGTSHAGRTVNVYYRLPVDFGDHLPAVLVYNLGGTEGYIDRTDRIGVDVYAEGTAAVAVAESIKTALSGDGGTYRDVPGVGLIDKVDCEVTPHDVPYPSDLINQAQAVYRLTVRPI